MENKRNLNCKKGMEKNKNSFLSPNKRAHTGLGGRGRRKRGRSRSKQRYGS